MVCVLPARWRRSSRPIGYAVSNVLFLFRFGKDGRDALRRAPTGCLNPLGGSEGRGRGENTSSGKYKFQFHGGTPTGASIWFIYARHVARDADAHEKVDGASRSTKQEELERLLDG